MKLTAALASVGLLAVANAQTASEPLSVTVTVPVDVPLQVPAGMSFHDAAVSFVEKTGLGEGDIAAIESALQKRWEQIQLESKKIDTCTELQMQHSVVPLKDWGTLPNEARAQWIELGCDSKVPAEPPVPLVTLEIIVDSMKFMLRAFEGDTVRAAVERFCTAHNLDFEQNGKVLIDALAARVSEAQSGSGQAAAEEEKTFLFSIPFNIDGKLIRLRVHEGDMLDTLVAKFCSENGVSEEDFGQTIRQAIIDTTALLKKELEEEAAAAAAGSKQGVDQAANPKLLLEIPIRVDDKDQVLQLFDGDLVDVKIAQFCEKHGIDQTVYAPQLLQHVAERTQALQQ